MVTLMVTSALKEIVPYRHRSRPTAAKVEAPPATVSEA
jgi:hypothetical protein